MPSKTPKTARSPVPGDLRSFPNDARLKQIGYAGEGCGGWPVIASINTGVDLGQRHAHRWIFPQHARQAGPGRDLDFLRADFRAPVPEVEIF